MQTKLTHSASVSSPVCRQMTHQATYDSRPKGDMQFMLLKQLISKGQRQTFIRYFRALLYLFNVHTLILAGLGCLAVYACDRYVCEHCM